MGSASMFHTPPRFRCYITDKPLTGYEQLAVGATTMGAFRGLFRPAVAVFRNDDLVVEAKTDPAAGGSTAVAAKIPIKDIVDVHTYSLSVAEQVRAAAGRAVVMGVAIALVIGIAVSFRSGLDKIVDLILLSLGGGLVIGFLFSFLPSLIKLQRDLIAVRLTTADNQVLLLAVKVAEKEKAFRLLGEHGIAVTEGPIDSNGS